MNSCSTGGCPFGKMSKVQKIILLIIIFLMAFYSLFSRNKKNENIKKNTPVVVINKESLIVEYGSKDIKPEQFVDLNSSKNIETLSFKEPIDTMYLGMRKVTVVARNKDIEKDFTFDIDVKDSVKPVIIGKNLEVEAGIKLDLEKYFSAEDVVDGKLPVEIKEGYINYNVEGSYEIVVSAVDKFGNRTNKTFKIIVSGTVEGETDNEYERISKEKYKGINTAE